MVELPQRVMRCGDTKEKKEEEETEERKKKNKEKRVRRENVRE